jgi:lysosome membrane protein 2
LPVSAASLLPLQDFLMSFFFSSSVQLFFERKVTYDGIPGFRYQTRENFLNQIGSCYGNDCFCVNKINGSLRNDDGCLYSGAIDLTDCLEAPIVGTAPHFYGADPVYNLMIDGTYPNPEKHQIFLEVEPRTGAPLRGGKKMQFNMFLRKIDQIGITNQFTTPLLLPVLWVDEGIELNSDMTGLIKGDLINTLLILDIVQWTLGKAKKEPRVTFITFTYTQLLTFSRRRCGAHCRHADMVLHREEEDAEDVFD